MPLVRRGQRFEGFTREGERVVLWAHRILADYDGLGHELSQIRGGLEGTLRLGAIPTAVPAVSLVTSPFCERHPLMHVEVVSLSSREIERRLDAFELDAGRDLPRQRAARERAHRAALQRALRACARSTGRSRVARPSSGPRPRPCRCACSRPTCRTAASSTTTSPPRARWRCPRSRRTRSALCARRRGWSSVMAHAWLSLFGVPEAMRAVPLVAPRSRIRSASSFRRRAARATRRGARRAARRLDLESELDRLVAGSRAKGRKR